MGMTELLIRDIEKWVKALVKTELDANQPLHEPGSHRAFANLDVNRVLETLHTPLQLREVDDKGTLAWDEPRAAEAVGEGQLPIPPPELRMGYGRTDAHYLEMGRSTSDAIRRALGAYGIGLSAGGAILDWGCASGRVLRHFAPEAAELELWGCDQDAPHISWARHNLSPPLHFVTSTAYPHLPFEDDKFRFIYGISVFTHLYQLVDAWLMEFRRILAPGGYALFTIHDENTWKWLMDRADNREALGPWNDWPAVFKHGERMERDVYVFRQGTEAAGWSSVQTFFRTDWIAREWGRSLRVVAIEPLFEVYQSMVLLQK
jgi:SAM-dependent methyltransferase